MSSDSRDEFNRPDDSTRNVDPDATVGAEGVGAASATGGIPESIGPYRIRHRLGEGGMGEVFLAEQTEPIQRLVALKVIKQGMDTRAVVGRFEQERQTLAMMNHPAIARVYEAGQTEQGRPYFAMEYVEGVPINEYCDSRRLDTRQRLELITQVCAGVQHAHQKAIIHRDLKPGNILVTTLDGKPVPKIIDFGIARATEQREFEQTMFTQFGHVIGTPVYMSPEQTDPTNIDIDTRTDIYSLGVVLYELLVGITPFDVQEAYAAGYEALMKFTREREAPRPSTRLKECGPLAARIAPNHNTDPDRLVRTLRGDLDWILLKTLEKDRNRRYETANALAMDIRRFLENEPVLASPPSRVYRLRKAVRRNRAASVAVVAVSLAMVTAVTATSWGLLRARRAEAHAAQEAEIAKAVNAFLNEDLLASVAPSAQAGRGKDVSMREVLDAAAARITSQSGEGGRFSDKPAVERAIRNTLGETYVRLGLYPEAEPHLERALQIAETHPGPQGLDLINAEATLGDLREKQGRFDEAEQHLARALQLRTAAYGADDAGAVSDMSVLARIYGKQGRSAEAEPLLRRTFELQRRLLGPQDTGTLIAMTSLANFYQESGRYAEAETLAVESLAIYTQYYGEEHENTMRVMNNLANIYGSQGRLEEALPLYMRALELKRKVLGDRHPSTLNTLNNLAEVQEQRGDYARAEALQADVLAARIEVLGADHPRTLYSQARLAYVRGKLGRLAEAEALARRTIDRFRDTLGDDHPSTIETEDILAGIMLAQGRAAEAARLLGRLETTLAEKQPDDRYIGTRVGAHLGLALAQLDRVAEAEARWDAVAKSLPEGEDETAQIVRSIVGHYERWDAAEPGKGYREKAAWWRGKLAQVGSSR